MPQDQETVPDSRWKSPEQYAMEMSAQIKRARDYVDATLETYIKDPPNSEYQLGRLSYALETCPMLYGSRDLMPPEVKERYQKAALLRRGPR